jgi:hypothetical protein
MKTTHCLIIALLAASPVAFAQVHTGLNAATGITGGATAPPVQTQVGAGASGAAGLNASQPPTGNIDAAANGSAAAQTHDLNAGSSGAVDVSTALNPSDTMRDINATAFDARKSVVSEVSDRIDAGKKMISSLKTKAESLDNDARTKFNTALDDAKAKEKILKRSLKEARNASNADAWSVAQATLAADYQAYATAVAELSATAQK